MNRFCTRNRRLTHNAGFSFLEIVLTITLIGAVLSPLYTVQYTVFGVATRAFAQVSRIFDIQNLLYPALLRKDILQHKSSQTRKEDPPTEFTYRVEDVPENSVLASFSNLHYVTVQGSWKWAGIEFDQKLLTFIYSPPPASKDGKQA